MTFVPENAGAGLKLLNEESPGVVDEARVKKVMEWENVEVVVDLRDGDDDAQGVGSGITKAVY